MYVLNFSSSSFHIFYLLINSFIFIYLCSQMSSEKVVILSSLSNRVIPHHMAWGAAH